MNQGFFKQIAWYSSMVLCWLALIIGFLYAPDFVMGLRAQKELRILTWGDIFDPAYVRHFEKKMGVTVRMSYYASNEELQVKLKKTGGAEYDLIVPSDYAVMLLRSEGLLKKLDRQRMPFFNRLNPRLLNHPFDPGNEYSVPFEWELYGIGYDTNFFAGKPFVPSWELLFNNPRGAYKVVMTNDPVEAVVAAARFLYPHVDRLQPAQIAEVQQLLRRQNRWVEAYSSIRAGYYLATGNSPLAFTTTTYIGNAQKYAPHIAFALPLGGGFITIENFALPVRGKEEDLVYEFISFMYTTDAVVHHVREFSNLPAVVDEEVLASMSADMREYLLLPAAEFQALRFFKRVLSEAQINDIWIAAKA